MVTHISKTALCQRKDFEKGPFTYFPYSKGKKVTIGNLFSSAVFESAVVKIINGSEGSLTRGEAQKVQHLMLQDDNDVLDDDNDSATHEREDFATALLKDTEKRKAPRLEQQLSRYVKLNHLTPTSNKWERLFSDQDNILSSSSTSSLATGGASGLTAEATGGLALNDPKSNQF
jgi:hypothetical protein